MQFLGNIQAYWLLLKDLDRESKLSLIELLTQSLKKTSNKKKIKKTPSFNNDDWIDEFYGCWNTSNETAEDIIRKIEDARTMGRKTETL